MASGFDSAIALWMGYRGSISIWQGEKRLFVVTRDDCGHIRHTAIADFIDVFIAHLLDIYKPQSMYWMSFISFYCLSIYFYLYYYLISFIAYTLDSRFSGLDGAGTYPDNEKVRITQMYLCNANKIK